MQDIWHCSDKCPGSLAAISDPALFAIDLSSLNKTYCKII